MKKLLAFTLVLTLIVTLSISVIPSHAVSEKNPEQEVDSVELLSTSELSALKKSKLISEEGFNQTLDLLTESGIEINSADYSAREDIISVQATAEGVKSDIQIQKAEQDETIVLKIIENDKIDVIEFDNDGTIFLDGNPVILDYSEENCDDMQDTIEANGAYRYYSSCPVSNASNYTYYAKTKTYNMKLRKLICRCTVSGIMTICSAAVGGWGAAIGSYVLSTVISEATLADGEVLKIKAKIYYHKGKKSFMVNSSQGCQKEVCDFYGARNKKLNKSTKTLYRYYHVNAC